MGTVLLMLCASTTTTTTITNLTNCSNVVGSTETPYVTYLGEAAGRDACITLCTSAEDCMSYTYYSNASTEPSLAGKCYARLGHPLFTPVEVVGAFCGQVAAPCRGNADCSYNGICNSTAQCDCRPGWTGLRCGTLDLLPMAPSDGGLQEANTSTWGGAVVRASGTYHMIASRMRNHCGLNTWQLNSEIVHATAEHFSGPYTYSDTVRAPFGHEPDMVLAPTGEAVMFYTGYTFNSTKYPLCSCTSGSTGPHACEKMPPWSFITYMQYKENISSTSPWSDPTPISSCQCIYSNKAALQCDVEVSSCDSNLAGVITASGGFVGMLRTWNRTYTGGERSQLYLVRSSDWKNTTAYVTESASQLFPELISAGAEDPFVWVDCDGHYHALFHNMSPNVDGIDPQTVCGGHAYSADGVHWIYSGVAYTNHVDHTDGTSTTFTRRERPHLVFADDGCTPLALTNGVVPGGSTGDASHTLLQRVAQRAGV